MKRKGRGRKNLEEDVTGKALLEREGTRKDLFGKLLRVGWGFQEGW